MRPRVQPPVAGLKLSHSADSQHEPFDGDVAPCVVTWKTMIQKTYSPKKDEIERQWWIVDAEGKTLGRLATHVASRLRGKHKPTFTPHADMGDFVVVINADKIVLTGRKEEQKIYYRHSGRPGGLKTETARERRAKRPIKMIEAAVWGMLPKKSLGRRQIRHLKVYAGPEHPHHAQQPEVLELKATTGA